ncbi:response regulator [Gemmatimonadota bacterium]
MPTGTGSMGSPFRLLWADDEIDLLRSHILYLEERGFEVTGVHSGEDALQLIAGESFDLLLLDERMPGLDGIGVLERLRGLRPDLPVVMVTKQEDEGLMEEAIGRSIADFLTKPVNPSQVLSVCKRVLESSRLRGEAITRDYTREFARLSGRLSSGPLSPVEWGDLAEALAWWSLQLDETGQEGLAESLLTLQREADSVFARQVIETYPEWVATERERPGRPGERERDPCGLPPLPVQEATRPFFTADVAEGALLPLLAETGRVLFIVLDCLRLDQWLAIEPLIPGSIHLERVPIFSLLPSASPYSRNALLSGCFPDEIAGRYPELWTATENYGEEGLNRFEPEMITGVLERAAGRTGNARLALFERVRSPAEGEAVARRLAGGVPDGLSVAIFNFLDLLVHDRTESRVLKELAPDSAAFRSVAREWFRHSPLPELIERAAGDGVPILIATDHGSTQVGRSIEVKADHTATHGVRYKVGRNLNADQRWTHRIDDLASWRLPPGGLTTTYLLARENAFLLFTSDAALQRKRFDGSFQHGGISLSEVIIPLVRLTSR